MIELKIYNDDFTGANSVDLYEDEPIYYELSFAEIQDISKKNSGFTKTFNLPGTPENNRFFNHFYDPSVVFTSFDTRIKHNAALNFNGYEIAVGYIRLEKVTKAKGDIIYTVIFYNQIGDLVAKMGDKKLNALTTNGNTGHKNFNHQNSIPNIVTSWEVNDSTPSSGLLDGRILYPLLHRGYAYNELSGGADILEIEQDYTGLFNLSGVQVNSIARGFTAATPEMGVINQDYLSPSIQLKALFELILNDNGYKLESDFFTNNPWVNRIYMPTTYASEDFGLVQIPNETWDVVENQFEMTQIIQNYFFTYDVAVSDEYNNWVNTQEFQPSTAGWHLYELEFNVENLSNSQRDIDVNLEDFQVPGFVYSNLFSFEIAGNDSTNFSVKKWVNIPQNAPTSPIQNKFSLVFRTTAGGFSTQSFTNVSFRQLKSSRLNINTEPVVQMNQQLGDDISQVDLVSSVLKQFNLIMVPKVNEENTLIVEPLKDWIGSGELIDWTTKVNRDSSIQITDTTKFINGIIDLKPKEGKDFLNENFKKENKLLFGQRQEALNTDYKQKTSKIDSIFTISQQELIRPTSDYTLPVFYQAKDENINGENLRIYKNFKTTPTLIYYSGLRNIYNDRNVYINWFYTTNNVGFKLWPQSHHLTYYPVVTATQNKSISFNKDQEQGQYKQITVHDDCYTMFYENMVDDYLDEESRFMKCELYLEPEEIKQLDFSEQIIIDNARWRINKLTNIDMTKPSLVKGEFIKLFEDLDTESVDADTIELTSCSGGTSLYATTLTNSDLVLLSGNIVKVGGDCYLVNPPTPYDPLLPYQSLILDNNNGVPFIYSFCSECGQTGGGLCEPLVNINAVTGTGTTVVGIYSETDPGIPTMSGEPPECYEEVYYFDCDTNLFLVKNQGGSGECDNPDGFSNISGTSIIIPSPIGRPGHLVTECCFDPNTGFAYDVYTEVVGNTMILHKICCDIQPPTTTTTTVLDQYVSFRRCGSTFLTTFYPQGFSFVVGKTYDLLVSPDCSGFSQYYDCYEYMGLVSTNPSGCITTIDATYDDCNCDNTTTTTTTATPGTPVTIEFCDGGFTIDVMLDPAQGGYNIGDVLNSEVCIWQPGSSSFNCYQNICYEIIGVGVNNLNTAAAGSVFQDCPSCDVTATTTTTAAPLCVQYQAIAPSDSGEVLEFSYTLCNGIQSGYGQVFWGDSPYNFCAQQNSIVYYDQPQGSSVTQTGLCFP